MRIFFGCFSLLCAFLLASCNDNSAPANISDDNSTILQEQVPLETSENLESTEPDESENSFTIDVPSREESGTESIPGDITNAEQLEGKFGEYCFAEEKDDLKILTIYSAEQITELKSKLESKEGLILTSEEIQFLIEDTISLFSSYDIIYVRALDGTVETYYGLPFYGSDAYFEYFNGFDIVDGDSSFQFKYDILNIAYKRIAALHSACYSISETVLGEMYLVLADSGPLSEKEIETLIDFHATVYLLGGSSHAFSHLKKDMFYFEIQGQAPKIEHYIDISQADKNSTVHLLTGDFGFPGLGQYKYDMLTKNVVIELWEEKSQSLIARIRIDEESDSETFAELIQRAGQVTIVPDSERCPPTTNYRVAVYFNGITCTNAYFENFAFKYYPDGNIDQFAYVMGTPVFWERENGEKELGVQGCSVLTEYINELLLEKLN